MYFDELNLDDSVLDALDAMRFDECTPIQEKSIPPLLEGHDLMGIAQTGTGKTAAYLLPILNRLQTEQFPHDAINCIIMAPTRELTQQIDRQVEGFAYFMPISSVAVYGGNDGQRFEQEKRGMSLGADIIIATPGRLISHLTMGNLDLSKVSFFVLDEADRMLDMGFHDDIIKIASHLPENRQTLLFSATMPNDIRKLAQSLLHNPVEVRIAVSKPADKIRQTAYICYEQMKDKIVNKVLEREKVDRVLIFASKKSKVKELAHNLHLKNLVIGAMHSDLEQSERDMIMHNFRNGHINVLIATDIVSRGIDIDDIQMVINYEVPHDPEDYVHRIGRTARANREGLAVTLVSPHDKMYLDKIERLIECNIEQPELPVRCGEKPTFNTTHSVRNSSKSTHHHDSNHRRRKQSSESSSVQHSYRRGNRGGHQDGKNSAGNPNA